MENGKVAERRMPGGCLSTAPSTAKHSNKLSGTYPYRHRLIQYQLPVRKGKIQTKLAQPLRYEGELSLVLPRGTRCKPPSTSRFDDQRDCLDTPPPRSPQHARARGYLLICLSDLYKVVDDLSLLRVFRFVLHLHIKSPTQESRPKGLVEAICTHRFFSFFFGYIFPQYPIPYSYPPASLFTFFPRFTLEGSSSSP